MNVKIYSIFDSCAESYLQPFFAFNRGSAIRMFTASLADETSVFCKYPNEYILYEIGSFDDVSGQVLSSTLERLGTGLEFMQFDKTRRDDIKSVS